MELSGECHVVLDQLENAGTLTEENTPENVIKNETKAGTETLALTNVTTENIVPKDDLSNDIETSNAALEAPIEEKDSKNINELIDKLAYQQRIIEQNAETIKFLEEKNAKQEHLRKELECMLENATKQKEAATKKKENMVIRYAVGEKNVIKERQQKEQAEKKLKDAQKEIQLFQQKMQTMISEKARICQMLDNKCYEHRTAQQELEKVKQDLNNVETKLKWHQSSLKTEVEAHRDCQAKVETLNSKLQEYLGKIESAKKNAEDTVQNFMTSQENRAYVLDQQVKELQASLILLRHEKIDRDQQIKVLQGEMDRLQGKQKEIIDENNSLSQKVQQLERERSEGEQKLSEMRNCQDQQRQDAANLQTRNVQLEQLKLQLKHEQEQLAVANQQIELFKQRNQEIDTDIESCRIREAELLLFTQQLTDKNVRLQSEFTSMETKVQQLLCEQTILKRQLKEQETKYNLLSSTLDEQMEKSKSESEMLRKTLEETQHKLSGALREVADERGENMLIKRKYELSLKEVNKELQQARKKLEAFESGESSTSTSSSGSSLNVNSQCQNSSDSDHVKVVSPNATIDKQTLIEHIVKLQRISAKKSEKIDFLEEHINSLVLEIQKKAKLLQGYAAMEQSSILNSKRADANSKDNKAQLARLNSIMASMYSQKFCDGSLTLELSMEMNRKLQAVLEDALMKNITLSENVDTLGSEIDRLNQLLLKKS